jgi:hypothetical protein
MFAISPNLRRRDGHDGCVVLDIEEGRMFSLNMTAARILSLVEEGCGEREIVEKIALRCGLRPATANDDVHEFLVALRTWKLIEERCG